MPRFNWVDITYEDVVRAIKKFIMENPEFPEPRSTYLLFEGRKLPAKHIRGMAYYEHYGVEINKSDFTGGMETVRFFKRLGFEMDYTGGAGLKKTPSKAVNKPDSVKKQKQERARDNDDMVDQGTEFIKVAMYLQTNELKNRRCFNRMLPLLRTADADIIVFPENCYVPFVNWLADKDIEKEEDRNRIYEKCVEFSNKLGKAVIVSSCDKDKTVFSVFANAFAKEDETVASMYIKHTMCKKSCLGFKKYPAVAAVIFEPIKYRGFLIGMTICYDCNHAIFSRIYGIHGVDLIINSTGGNVVYDKWYKYNKARAIENNCFELVTMGGDGTGGNGNNYVYGFNRNGGQVQPVNLNGSSENHNTPGGLYVYKVTGEAGLAEPDNINQAETISKNSQFQWPIGGSDRMLESDEKISDSIYRKAVGKYNVFLLLVDGKDIMKPEKVQPLMYAKELRKYNNRKYIIINRHDHIDPVFFEEKLSVILKVRAMENFCAVILESDDLNKCYQCGMNRTSQVVRAVDGEFGIDLNRTSGPDAIWKNKAGMQASWRENYEWLVENAEKLST